MAAAGLWATPATQAAKPAANKSSEDLVHQLYASLTDAQRKEICFDWDYKDARGVLRRAVANNWQVTDQNVHSDFYTSDQQQLIEAIYFSLVQPRMA